MQILSQISNTAYQWTNPTVQLLRPVQIAHFKECINVPKKLSCFKVR